MNKSSIRREQWIIAATFAAIAFGGAAAALERPWPTNDDTAFAAFLSANRAAILAQSLLFIAGSAFYLWFLSGLRNVLGVIEGGRGSLAQTAFAAGVVWVTLNAIGQAPQIVLTLPSQSGMEHGMATVLADLCFVTLTIANLPLALMFVTIAIVILRTDVLPHWLGWLATVAAAAALLLSLAVVPAAGPLAPQGWLTLVLYPAPVLWLIPAAVVMIRRMPVVMAHPSS